MKQILQSYKSGELWLAEVPTPLCKSTGILLRTAASFVSAGTERMLVDFAQKNMIGKALAMPDQVKKVLRKIKTEGLFETIEKVQNKLDQPIPLGYSCAGVVEEVGRNVEGFSKGDRIACGGAGYANHAEYNFVPKNLVVKIPDSVSFEDASCATVGSIALQGVRICDVRVGEYVCVIGLGLLGILCVQILKASGVFVLGFDVNENRCKLAKELGADIAVSTNVESACKAFTDGHGVDAVLISAATKSDEPVTVAGEICRHKGRVVVTGMVGMDIPRDMYYKKELEFRLSCSYGPGRYDPTYEEAGIDYPYGYVRWTEQRNIKAFIELVAQGKITPTKIITHRFSIDESLKAYELLLGKIAEPYLGIVITYENHSELPQKTATIEIGINKNPKNQPISIGFIGAGNFTKGVLLPHLLKRKDIQLQAICTASGMNAAETARKNECTYATTDHTKILQDPSINTVFVTTRHDSHAAFLCEAVEAGKHVFVEKPLAISQDQLNSIEQVMHGSKSLVTVGFNRRFSPHSLVIRNYFKSRTTPLIVLYRINAGTIPKDNWIQDAEIGGGRIIGEVCHFVDFCSFIIGTTVSEVMAMSIDSQNTHYPSHDSISISLKYADGSIATILYASIGSSELPKEYCECFADESIAVMNNFCVTTCHGRLGRKKLRGKQQKGFIEELDAFFNAIKNGSLPPIAYDSLINTTKTTFSIIESLHSKQLIKL